MVIGSKYGITIESYGDHDTYAAKPSNSKNSCFASYILGIH